MKKFKLPILLSISIALVILLCSSSDYWVCDDYAAEQVAVLESHAADCLPAEVYNAEYEYHYSLCTYIVLGEW